MKPGIIITAMAALALAVFAVAEAQGGGGDLSIRLSGSNLIITTEDRVTTPVTEAGRVAASRRSRR